MARKKTTVIIVTAYGEDNYYQKKYEDVVGIYTSVQKAINGAKADGMTNSQMDYLDNLNAFFFLGRAINENKEESYQVDFWEEDDPRRKPITSSYMFQTYNLD